MPVSNDLPSRLSDLVDRHGHGVPGSIRGGVRYERRRPRGSVPQHFAEVAATIGPYAPRATTGCSIPGIGDCAGRLGRGYSQALTTAVIPDHSGHLL